MYNVFFFFTVRQCRWTGSPGSQGVGQASSANRANVKGIDIVKSIAVFVEYMIIQVPEEYEFHQAWSTKWKLFFFTHEDS